MKAEGRCGKCHRFGSGILLMLVFVFMLSAYVSAQVNLGGPDNIWVKQADGTWAFYPYEKNMDENSGLFDKISYHWEQQADGRWKCVRVHDWWGLTKKNDGWDLRGRDADKTQPGQLYHKEDGIYNALVAIGDAEYYFDRDGIMVTDRQAVLYDLCFEGPLGERLLQFPGSEVAENEDSNHRNAYIYNHMESVSESNKESVEALKTDDAYTFFYKNIELFYDADGKRVFGTTMPDGKIVDKNGYWWNPEVFPVGADGRIDLAALSWKYYWPIELRDRIREEYTEEEFSAIAGQMEDAAKAGSWFDNELKIKRDYLNAKVTDAVSRGEDLISVLGLSVSGGGSQPAGAEASSD